MQTPAEFASVSRSKVAAMRKDIFNLVDVGADSTELKFPISGDSTLRWTKSRFKKLDEVYTEIKSRRWQCAVFDGDNRRIAVADFSEHKTTEWFSDGAWNHAMDDVSQHGGEIARAFTSGWSAELLAHFGNVAVMEHVSAKPGVSSDAWVPLVERFISKKIFGNTFVLIGDIFPYDYLRAIQQIEVDDTTFSLCEPRLLRRWDAKKAYFETHFHLRRYVSPDGERSRWMYRLRDPFDPEAAPDFTRDHDED